jgi:hypothetical protein
MRSRLVLLFLCLCVCVIPSCEHGEAGTWTGRRWHVHTPGASCWFWGYVKRPGESWQGARLVIMDERNGVLLPDRAPAAPGPPFHGYDHNFEYEIRGRFTGQRAYDPNSDLELPLFSATGFRLMSRNPGPLPGVGLPQDNRFVPGREAGNRLSSRLR